MSLSGYVPILVMILVSGAIASAMVIGSFFLGPKKPTVYKSTPYECGMTPIGSARERFPIKFFLVAMLFIVFDIETIFLYPWAVTYHGLAHPLKWFSFFEMAVFVVILFVGYGYIIGKGALDWEESEQKQGDVITAELLAPRPALRYGNEHSGPVDIGKTPVGNRAPAYGASSQEAYQQLGSRERTK